MAIKEPPLVLTSASPYPKLPRTILSIINIHLSFNHLPYSSWNLVQRREDPHLIIAGVKENILS